MTAELAHEVVRAAGVLSRRRLVDAFGHVSARDGDAMLVTAGVPLGAIRGPEDLVRVALDAGELPAGAPREAWMHLALYRSRPDVGGIARGQPAAVAALAAGGLALIPVHGQSALLDPPVRTHADSRLARDAASGAAVAAALGDGAALILRGNGALCTGPAPGIAAARLYLLEATARLNLDAAGARGGTPPAPLPDEELAAWRVSAGELLGRLWAYLDAAPEA